MSDDSNTEDIVVDLRGCTLVGEFLNLECTTTSRSILLSNGTLQISDGIRVKRVDSIVFEKVVSTNVTVAAYVGDSHWKS